MAGITQATAQAQLDLFLAAAQAIAANQEYWVNAVRYKRADLGQVMRMIEFWDNKVKSLSRGGIRIVGATPLD